MDPAAHTLVGAILAETGFKKVSRYVTPTLLIGVNLPDIDAAVKYWGQDASLFFRRGWTHGILAMVLLPVLLYAGIYLWHRFRQSRSQSELPFRGGWIIALAYLSVLTHPLLDWMNTYGVRLLMPFDGSWFYGDTLFIIDPWIWLILAGGVILARRTQWFELAFWITLAVLSSLLILKTDIVSKEIKLVWLAGIALIAGIRFFIRHRQPEQKFARAGLGLVVIYILTVFGFARVTENVMAGQYEKPIVTQVNPMPGLPFTHRTILQYESHYLVVDTHGCQTRVEREKPDDIVKAAMRDESIRGFINWTRFPYWEKQKLDDGWLVTFRDLRYQGPGNLHQASIGYAAVVVPFDL